MELKLSIMNGINEDFLLLLIAPLMELKLVKGSIFVSFY